MSLAALPLQLVRPTRPGSTRGRRLELVRYAYCLLDLAAETGNHPARVFETDRSFYHTRRISGEVVWQLTCRTNGRGFLVPVLPGPPDDPFLQNDAAAHQRIDREQPLLVRPAMRFNLYWTYHAALYQKARDPNSTSLLHEYLLHRCSTYFDRTQRELVQHMLRLAARVDRDRGHEDDMAWRENMIEHLFRTPGVVAPRWRRTVIRYSADRTFYMQPEDDDLHLALRIADEIEEARNTVEELHVMDEINTLYRVLETVDRYERTPMGQRDPRDWISTTMSDAVRMRRRFAQLRRRLIGALEEMNWSFRQHGVRLAPLLQNALLQASSHYERPVAQRYAERLMNAMGLALTGSFHTDFLRDASRFNERTQAASQGGVSIDPANDPLGAFLASYTLVKDAGVFDAADFVDKTTEWMDGLLAAFLSEEPGVRPQCLDRLHQFLLNIQNPSQASGAAVSIVRSQDIEVNLEVEHRLLTPDPDVDLPPDLRITYNAHLPRERLTIDLQVRRTLQATHTLLERAGKLLGIINFYLAIDSLHENQSFKNYLSAASSTAEAATIMIDIIRSLERNAPPPCLITRALVSDLSGIATIIVAGIDMLDHIEEGNIVAAMGDGVQALGGIIPLLYCNPGGAVVGVLLVVSGTLIVYWSTSPEAAIIRDYNENHRTLVYRHLHDLRRLRDQHRGHREDWDRYLHRRQESY